MSGPWALLGLAPTGDARAIRRAYAARLKAIDVDADPAGFERLRRAHDAALAWAGGTTEPDVAPEDERVEASLVEPETEAEPGVDYGGHAERLHQLLAPGEARAELTAAEQDEAAALLMLLLADPRLERIDFLAQAEPWFAELMARSIPRSDPLLETVAARFGWPIAAARIGDSPALVRIARRRSAYQAIDRLKQKSHPFHREWVELTRPATERSRRGWWLRRKRVLELLNSIRAEQPELEGNLDPWRVTLWTRPPSRISMVTAGVGVWLLIQVLLHVLPAAPSDPVMTPPTVERPDDAPLRVGGLVSPENDVPAVLWRVAGSSLDAATLEARNPGLYERLLDDWRKGDAHGTLRRDWVRDEGLMLIGRYLLAVRQADYRNAAEFQAIQFAKLDEAEAGGWCAAVIDGKSDAAGRYSDALVAREWRLVGRLLQAAPVLAPDAPTEHRVRLDGAIVRDVGRRSGLDHDDLRAALMDRGPVARRCRARQALIEAVLALPPKQALPLLRAM